MRPSAVLSGAAFLAALLVFGPGAPSAPHSPFAARLAPAWAAPAQDESPSPLPLDAFTQSLATPPGASGGPRLLVCLLYDQMREDYLDRFRPVFGKDGFRRLVDDGARFKDCNIPYALTLTGPGHATWLSGAPPRVHGIVANAWHEDYDGCGDVACAGDPSVDPVGLPPGERGEAGSPRWMKAETVPDALRGVTHGASRVVAISDKARSAILPAGRRPTGVYWLDSNTMLMQTSTYYTPVFPAWAEAENRARSTAVQTAMNTPWTPLLPAESYRGTIVDDPSDTFPHPVVTSGSDLRSNAVGLTAHPYALEGLFGFARAAVVGERLGTDDVADVLILSISVTDRVGHIYGPDSPEVLDIYARADRQLAAFLQFLDQKVGRDRYAVTLTADHGVSPTKNVARLFLSSRADSIGGVPDTTISSWVGQVLERASGRRAKAEDRRKGFAHATGDVGIVFEDSLLKTIGLTRERAARMVADSAYTNPYLSGAYTSAELRVGGDVTALSHQYALSWYPGRAGDVVLVPRPYVIFDVYPRVRTSHGSPWRYDAHVPLLFWGYGVKRGTILQSVSTLDIAPTVSEILGIDAPAQSSGRVLHEALDPQVARTR